MTDDELRDLLALAAVGALTDEEQMDVDAALEDRPDLAAELDRLLEVATTLADAVAETPPPDLRSRLLATIADTPQLVPETPVAAPAPAERPLAPVVPIASARRRRWMAVGAAAAAAVALLVGVVVVAPWSDSGPSDQIAAVLESGDTIEIPMPGELPGMSILYSATEAAAVLTGDGIPVPEDDRVYELWAIRGSDAPEPVGTFRPDADGEVAVYLPGIDPASAVWAVTEEPAGGSLAPTLPILNATA